MNFKMNKHEFAAGSSGSAGGAPEVSSSMSVSVSSVRPFDFKKSNLDEEWKRWKTRFEIYLNATGLADATDKRKICLLLHLMGEGADDIFASFELNLDATTHEAVLKKFDAYFLPQKNLAMERYNLFTHKQGSASLTEYATSLKTLAVSCELGDLKDSIVRDLFICGISNKEITKKLLRDNHDRLEKVLEVANTYVRTGQQADVANNSLKTADINAVKSRPRDRRENRGRSASRGPSGRPCKRCNTTHEYKKCPAWGSQCIKCNGKNHWAKVCKSSANEKKVNTLGVESYFIGTIDSDTEPEKWMATFEVHGKKVSFQIDTGAMINLLPRATMYELNIPMNRLAKVDTILNTINSTVNVLGKVNLEVKYKSKFYDLEFFVVDTTNEPIVGLKTSQLMKLVKLVKTVCFSEKPQDIVQAYKSVFVGLGKLPDKVSLAVDESVNPRVCANRKIPVSLEARVKAELARMESDGVIRKASEPTDWVSNLVIVEKPNGKLRLCMDPVFLNKAIKRAHFPFPDIETMKSKLEGATHFSVLDAASGFWQLELDEPSKKLCTFTTPYGRYSYCRLPFGVKSSPEVFLQVMQKHFGGIENVYIFMDHFLIAGNEKTHAIALKRVLEKAREIGLKFNLDKSKIDQKSVKYCGHVFSQTGVSVDPEKVKAIENLEEPKDVPSLQRVIGMFNYLREYVPNFSEHTASMRQLLKKDVDFVFTEKMKKDFQALKKALKHATLAYYDPMKGVKLSVDSSSVAIGCCLMQEGRPVAYASTALTSAQKRYSQIEKELLAIVYGCTKFHTYLYGKNVDVETDHKPLESIFDKPLVNVSPRLQRLLMKLQGYVLKVRWVP